MDVSRRDGPAGRPRRLRLAVTLVELLVVVSVIGILMALLLPALLSARESSRQMSCQGNLRQIGAALQGHAQRDQRKRLCSGAFDWVKDGGVTEVGWVADLVNSGVPVGKMLCGANTATVAATYNDLLKADTSDTSIFNTCLDRLGSGPQTEPDGTVVKNPCRAIVETPLAPGSDARRLLIEEQILKKHYNTNYTASWFLARTGVILDDSGNLKSTPATCTASLSSRSSTYGPLMQAAVDTAAGASSFVPLLGDGAPVGLLDQPLGDHQASTPVTRSFTAGPVLNPGMNAPSFAAGTSRDGASGWWKVWNRDTLQDYRGFAPVHRGVCNVLFADGSVRGIVDQNHDGLLNNGFTADPANGFADSSVEMPAEEVFSRYSLRAK